MDYFEQSPVVCLVNGQLQNSFSIYDRGFHYGDGVFETIALKNYHLEFWDLHLERLKRGCQKLNIPFNDEALLQHEISSLAAHCQEGVIKIIITRGQSGRGYQPSQNPEASRYVICYPWPQYPKENATKGINAVICKTRLVTHPQLIGIKSLNCLQYVMASQEWQAPYAYEGLMLDEQGCLIEGTRSNLFMVVNGGIKTPSLDNNGIPGIMRYVLINACQQLHIPLTYASIRIEELKNATEIFICNSIIGIWPIKQLEQYQFKCGPVTLQLQNFLNSV